MKSFFTLLLLTLACAGESLYWKQIADEYKKPLDLVPLPSQDGANDHFLVVQQTGEVFLTDFRGLNKKVLDLKKKITSKANEQGLFTIALSPDFKKTGKAYFKLTNPDDDVEVWRYWFNTSDLSQRVKEPEVLLTVEQHSKNHNGGWIGFGPDGMLYIATGDGGGAHDRHNLAQNLEVLQGKLLRIDVSGAEGYRVPVDNPFINKGKARAEIFSYGLRNPWRCDWEGDLLFIADVGQGSREEVNVTPIDELKGANFGWRLREGKVATIGKEVGGEKPAGAVDPVLEYSRKAAEGDDMAGHSITGGVYYDGKISSLKERYFFADFARPLVWSFKLDAANKAVERLSHAETIKAEKGKLAQISSFSKDNDGELYLLTMKHGIYKLSEKE